MPFAFKIQTKLLSMEFRALHSVRLCLSPLPQTSIQSLDLVNPVLFLWAMAFSSQPPFFPCLTPTCSSKIYGMFVYADMDLVLYTYIIISNPPNNPTVLREFAEGHTGNKKLNRDSNLPDPSALLPQPLHEARCLTSELHSGVFSTELALSP